MKQKTYFLIVMLLSLLGLGIALVSQYVFNMQPCAWCVLQRLILIVCAVLAAVGFFINRCFISSKLASILGMIAGLSGITAAWYQYSVASNLFSCAQTFADKFILTTKLDAIMPWFFGVYATCADAKVTMLGIEYAVWGLILFSLLSVLSLISVFKNNTNN